MSSSSINILIAFLHVSAPHMILLLKLHSFGTFHHQGCIVLFNVFEILPLPYGLSLATYRWRHFPCEREKDHSI